ncbi:hypothetical protein D3C75_1032890 [compost metagenome]
MIATAAVLNFQWSLKRCSRSTYNASCSVMPRFQSEPVKVERDKPTSRPSLKRGKPATMGVKRVLRSLMPTPRVVSSDRSKSSAP